MFRHTVTMDTYGERIKQNSSSLLMVERKITADQILHLCRLFADQSRNSQKSFDRRISCQEDCTSSMEIQSEDITSSRSLEQDSCDDVDSSEFHQEKTFIDNNNDTFKAIPRTKTKQAKKDILNKIRNQIFERKRQKLAIVQQRTVSSVWRPW